MPNVLVDMSVWLDGFIAGKIVPLLLVEFAPGGSTREWTVAERSLPC